MRRIMMQERPVPSSLTDVETREVSLVRRGAVGRRFAMRKSDQAQVESALCTPLPEAMVQAVAKLSPNAKAQMAMRSSLQVLNAYRDHLTDAHIAALHGILGLTPDDDAGSADDETTFDDDEHPDQEAPMSDTQKNDAPTPAPAPVPTVPTTPATPAGDEPPAAPAPNPGAPAPAGEPAPATPPVPGTDVPAKEDGKEGEGDVAKSATDRKIDAVEKAMRRENAELRKALNVELAKRRGAEAVAKAKREFSPFGDHAAWGDLIVKLEDAGLYKQAEPLLRANAEVMKRANILGTLGHGEAGSTGPASQLHVAAAAIAKRDGISESRAMQKAMESDPSLYEAARRQSLYPSQD